MAKAKRAQTFEEALAALEGIVTAIESGEVGLEESIKKYEEGMALVRRCRAILASAEQKIQALGKEAGKGEEGGLVTSELDLAEEEQE